MIGRPEDLPVHQTSHSVVNGPGLLESLMWVSGYHFAQMLAVILLLVALVLAAFGGWPSDPETLLQVSQEFVATDTAWLLIAVTGAATLGALFIILPAAFWRLRPSPRKALGTHRPDSQHLVLLAGAVLPLGILSDELYRASSFIVEQLRLLLIERVPLLADLANGADTIALIQQQTASTAYPLLLVVVGLGPAIGEEVIFRGLIGRGLIARRGVVRGVLLTSLLFAMAHMSPAHAVATLPIAVFLHIAYLTTGSIWAPIFVHFLNNGLSVTMMKFGLGQDVHVSTVLLISSAAYVVLIGVLLLGRTASWETLLPRFAARRLTATAPTNRDAAGLAIAPGWFVAAAASGVLCFTCSFVAAAMAGP